MTNMSEISFMLFLPFVFVVLFQPAQLHLNPTFCRIKRCGEFIWRIFCTTSFLTARLCHRDKHDNNHRSPRFRSNDFFTSFNRK